MVVTDVDDDAAVIMVLNTMSKQEQKCSVLVPLRDEVCGRHNNIVLILYDDWNFPTSWRLQDSCEEFHCFLQNVWGAHVDFGNNNKYRHIQGQSKT